MKTRPSWIVDGAEKLLWHCAASRCRQKPAVTIAFMGPSFRLCDAHYGRLCDERDAAGEFGRDQASALRRAVAEEREKI